MAREVSTGRMLPRGLAAWLLVAAAVVTGCVAPLEEAPVAPATVDPQDPPAPAEAGPTPSSAAPSASLPANASREILREETFEGYFTFIVDGTYSPLDPAFFPVTFPAEYATAEMEMTWTPSRVSGDLSLMLHEPGMGGPDGMVAEIDGASPLLLEVNSTAIPAKEWWIVGYVPRDGRTTAVVDQPFTVTIRWYA